MDGTVPLRPTDAALAGLGFADARERVLRSFDSSFMAAALERHDGNVSAAARALGLHRQSLQKIMKRLGLTGRCGIHPPSRPYVPS